MKRQPVPFVWILHEDLNRSAKFLPNEYLDKNIKHLIACLICTRYYFFGIRTQALFKHYFSKDNAEDTLSKMFPTEDPNLLMKLNKFTFQNYSNRTVKWCRKCREHYLFCKDYLIACLNEETFRFGNNRKSHEIGNLLVVMNDGFEQMIPLGKLSKITYEWKSIPVKYRKKDILEGYKSLFLSKIEEPFELYAGSKRDIPDFVMEKFKLSL